MFDFTLPPAHTQDQPPHSPQPANNSYGGKMCVRGGLLSGVLALAAILTTSAPARAEVTVAVNIEIGWSDLIVYCKTEIKDGMVRYRVLDTWKGEYRPELFHDRPPAGYLHTSLWHGHDNPVAGREVVFFFSAESESGKINGNYSDYRFAYVVTNGTVAVIAPRGITWPSQLEEWTLADFKKFVLATARHERAVVESATAGGWVAALAAPSYPDPVAPLPPNSRLVQHDPPGSDADTTPPGRTTATGLWWALAAVLLGTGFVLGWRAHHRRAAKSS